jgi:excisionase family DNA binding protein
MLHGENELMIGPGDLLRVDEAAQLATVQPCTIRAWLTQGKLPRVKVGRCTRILRSDLEDLLRAGRSMPAAMSTTAVRAGKEGGSRAN